MKKLVKYGMNSKSSNYVTVTGQFLFCLGNKRTTLADASKLRSCPNLSAIARIGSPVTAQGDWLEYPVVSGCYSTTTPHWVWLSNR